MSTQFKLEGGRKWIEVAVDTDGTAFDLTSAGITEVKVAFMKPRTGTVIYKDGTITGASVVFDGVTRPANTWTEVVFTNSEIDEAGQWMSQLMFKIDGNNAGSNGWKVAFNVIDSAYPYLP